MFIVFIEISIIVGLILILVKNEFKYLSFLLFFILVRLIIKKKKYEKTYVRINGDKLEIGLLDMKLSVDREQVKSAELFQGKVKKLINRKKEFAAGTTLFFILKKEGLIHIKFTGMMEFKLKNKSISINGIALNLVNETKLRDFIEKKKKKEEISAPKEIPSFHLAIPPDAPLVINAQAIEKSYGKMKFMEIERFCLPQGHICGLVGENGAGKTTLIRILMTLLEKDAGSIKYFGREIKSIKEISRQVGYVPDIPVFYEKFTLIDYLYFLCRVYNLSSKEEEERIKKYLDYFKLNDYKNQFIFNLSLGLRKKLSILAALLHDPQLIIMDEPLIGLDPVSQWQLMQLLMDLQKEGKTFLVSSHTLEILEKLCSRIYILKKGHVLYAGVPEDLKAQTSGNSLLEAYMALIK